MKEWEEGTDVNSQRTREISQFEWTVEGSRDGAKRLQKEDWFEGKTEKKLAL